MTDAERIEQAVSDVIGDRCWSPVAQRWVTATAFARYIADALTPKPHELCDCGHTHWSHAPGACVGCTGPACGDSQWWERHQRATGQKP